MIDLKEYISDHQEEFDYAELPDGHEDRFKAKLDAVLDAGKDNCKPMDGRHKTSGKSRILRWIPVAAAAVVAAAIVISRPEKNVDWFAGVTDDPVLVYLAYSEKAGQMSREIFKKGVGGRWGTMVYGITEEAVPMIDQLPEELDDTVKAAIMKEYYGKLLDGLYKINKIKEL